MRMVKALESRLARLDYCGATESCGGDFFLRIQQIGSFGWKPDAGRVRCPSSEKRSNFLSRLTSGRELGRLVFPFSLSSSGSPASGSSITGSGMIISLKYT